VAVTGSGSSESRADVAWITADACLFTAASFCLLVVAAPLGIVVGLALTWWLHERPFDRRAAAGLVTGLVVATISVATLAAAIGPSVAALGPVAGSEFALPIATLALVSFVFLTVVVALDVAAVRDLMPSRRRHPRLAFARLAATVVIAVFVAIFTTLQMLYPGGEFGDAAVFGLMAAAAGTVAMFSGQAIAGRITRKVTAGRSE
jgi:hypothetical protein